MAWVRNIETGARVNLDHARTVTPRRSLCFVPGYSDLRLVEVWVDDGDRSHLIALRRGLADADAEIDRILNAAATVRGVINVATDADYLEVWQAATTPF